MSAKRMAWNEFSSSMASALICLARGRKFNFSKYIFDSLVRNVDSSSKFYMYPRFLQLMIDAQVGDFSSHTTKYTSLALTQKVFAYIRRDGKGFYKVDTPLFEGMLVPQQSHDDVAADNVADDVANVVADAAVKDENAAEPTPPTPATTPPHQQELIPSTSHDKIAQALEITKLKHRFRKLEKKSKLKALGLKRLRKVRTTQRVESPADTVMDDQEDASKQGGITKLDADADVTLEEVAAVTKDAKDNEAEPAELKEVIKVVTTAKPMIELVTAAATTITSAPSTARRRKGVVIRDPEEIDTPSIIVHFEPKSKDKRKGILVVKSKPLKKQAQIEQNEAYAREEDLYMLWQIVQERFTSSKPKNFSDDFMLNTLKAMFEKPNVEAHIWKNQRGSYGLAKVKRFRVDEIEDFKEYTQRDYYCWLKTYNCLLELVDLWDASGSTGSASDGKNGRTIAITTEDMQQRRNDVKARTTLFLARPDEHQLRLSKYKTAQELWAAILKTFGGNEATRKTKKNLLK
nr:hypothetical protein [Tanacetum cinerariifolium]